MPVRGSCSAQETAQLAVRRHQVGAFSRPDLVEVSQVRADVGQYLIHRGQQPFRVADSHQIPVLPHHHLVADEFVRHLL